MNTIGKDSAKLAGLQIDLLQKLRNGQITLDQLEWFLGLTKDKRDGFIRTPKALTKPRHVSQSSDLLELVSIVMISATTSKFVAKDKFVVNTKRNAKVLISAVWDNFTNWFLSGDGKIEDPINEQVLRYHKLRKSSVDGPIIAELGGEAKAETTLTEMFSLMEKQKNGEDGVLLNNGYANIFYIRDKNGVLRAVYVAWVDDGWYVYAHPVDDSHGWRDGSRVFSRNTLKSSETSVPV
jgi:hypothetical protein